MSGGQVGLHGRRRRTGLYLTGTFLLAQSPRLQQRPRNSHPAQPRGERRDGAEPRLPACCPARSRSVGRRLLGREGRARASPRLSQQVFERLCSFSCFRKESGNPDSPAAGREWISLSSGSLPPPMFLLVREFCPRK